MLTDLIQHPVTLIQNKGLDIAQGQLLIADQSIQAAGSADNDVGKGVLVRKHLNVLLDWSAPVEHRRLHIREILAEPSILVLDLIGKLASMAHDQDGAFSGNRVELVESRQNEDSGLSETRLGLAKYIDVQDRGRDADLLDCKEAGRKVRLARPKRKKESKSASQRSVHPPGRRHDRQVARGCPPKIIHQADGITIESFCCRNVDAYRTDKGASCLLSKRATITS